MNKRKVLMLLGVIVVIIVIVVGSVLWMAASQLVSPTRRVLMDYHREWLGHPAGHGLSIVPEIARTGATPYLLVQPDSSEGLSKRGAVIRQQLEERGIALPAFGEVIGDLVLLHGRNGRKEDLLPVAERFCAVGFRCILPDLPAHGENITARGYYASRPVEAELPAALLRELRQKFGLDEIPAGLWGMSMGGAFVAASAAEPDAPWKALVVVCSFNSLDAVVGNKVGLYSGPARLSIAWSIGSLSEWRGGVNLRLVQPEVWAAMVSTPLLMAHGTDDELIPPALGRKLFDAYASREKVWLDVPGGTHQGVLVTDMPLYAEMAAWFLKYLRPADLSRPVVIPAP